MHQRLRLAQWAPRLVGRGTATIAAAALLLAGGCRSVSTDPDREFLADVDRHAGDRTGATLSTRTLLDSGASEESPCPSGALTRDDAVNTAFRRNLSLVASTESLAIAQAQLAQAGLLQNPVLGQSSGLLLPVSPVAGRATFDLNISEQISTLVTRPGRVAVAQIARTEAGLDLASQTFDLAMQIYGKYDELLHTRRSEAVAMKVHDIYQRAADAAEARGKVGIVAPPEVNRARLQAADAQRQVRHLHSQYQRAERELHWLMGCRGEPAWTIPEESEGGTAPTVPLPSEADAQALALRYRLDAERAGFDSQLGDAAVRLAKANKFPQLSVGVESALDSGGHWSLGPFFNLGLPIFDSGQVGVDLAEAGRRKANKTLVALQGQARQDARTALSTAQIAAEDVVFYHDRLLPQQVQNIQLAEQSFRLGATDLDSYLNTLRDYVTALQSYEDVLDSYRSALVGLERATGLVISRMTPEAIREAAEHPPAAPAGGVEPPK